MTFHKLPTDAEHHKLAAFYILNLKRSSAKAAVPHHGCPSGSCGGVAPRGTLTPVAELPGVLRLPVAPAACPAWSVQTPSASA